MGSTPNPPTVQLFRQQHECPLPMRERRSYAPGGVAVHVDQVPDGCEGAAWVCDGCRTTWVVRKLERPRERGRVWNPNALVWRELGPLASWWVRRKHARLTANRARHGEQILAAEPGICRIVSYVARDDFTDHKRRVLVAAELSALDATVVVERMAAVLLELGRQAGYSASGVIDCFPDSHSAGPSGEDR